MKDFSPFLSLSLIIEFPLIVFCHSFKPSLSVSHDKLISSFTAGSLLFKSFQAIRFIEALHNSSFPPLPAPTPREDVTAATSNISSLNLLSKVFISLFLLILSSLFFFSPFIIVSCFRNQSSTHLIKNFTKESLRQCTYGYSILFLCFLIYIRILRHGS